MRRYLKLSEVPEELVSECIEAFKQAHPRVYEGETTNALDLYQRQATSTAKFFWSTREILLKYVEDTDVESHAAAGLPNLLDLTYVSLGLGGEAGEFLDKLKKVMRDDLGEITPEARDGLGKELGDVLWYTAVLAALLDYRLSEVTDGNARKLAKRYEAGTLTGSGDNR